MTPYYEDDAVAIYHADCREVLPLDGVGMVLTSPPYNLRGDGGRPRGGLSSRLEHGYASHGDDMPYPEYVAWQQDVLGLCWASLTDCGAIYYNHKPRVGGDRVRLPLDLVPEHIPMRQVIVWDRCAGFNRKFNYYVPQYEWIMLLAKPAFRTNTLSVADVWRIPIEAPAEHPAPFPLALAKRAVSTTDAPLIIDPFMGSGTTLRAAKDLGRRAIGIDVEERYCEIAAKRMGQGVLDFGAESPIDGV